MGKKNKVMIDKKDKRDLDIILELVDPTQEEMDLTFFYFRKYVDSSIVSYRTDCNCSNGFLDIYYRLVRWYRDNYKLFE